MGESPTITITKSLCERYDIGNVQGGHWAVIMLDERGGMLNIQSSFGTYGYSWSAPGDNFKHFLVEISADYLMGNLGLPNYFNGAATIARLRKDLLGRVRDRSDLKYLYTQGRCRGRLQRQWLVFRDWMRDAWDDIGELDTGGSVEAFGNSLQASQALSEIFELSEITVVTEFHPRLVAFTTRVWPLFTNHLRQELGLPLQK